MEIKIGSANDNDIILDHPSITRHHAIVTIKDDKHYVLRDLKSKNGIRVNNRRVRQARIDKDDKIYLGEHMVENDLFFSKIKQLHNETRKDFTEEYIDVFKEFKKYEQKKNKIMQPPWLPILIRIGPGVIFIFILIVFPKGILDNNLRIILIMLTGIISTVTATFSSRSSRKRDKLDQLKLEYEDVLICPKCNVTLINHSLTYLLGKGKCINKKCDATYEIKP